MGPVGFGGMSGAGGIGGGQMGTGGSPPGAGAGAFSAFGNQRWLEYKNDGSVEVSSFGALEITGSSTRDQGEIDIPYLQAKRPTVANLLGAAINGPIPVAAGKYGILTFDSPIWALYDTGNTPAYGQSWGTQVDLFTLKFGNAGFNIIGGHTAGRVLVTRPVFAGAFVGQTDGSGITARSGTTPGTGTVTIYYLVSTTLTSTGRTLTVKNMTDTAVAASTYIQCKFDMWGTAWVDVEEC